MEVEGIWVEARPGISSKHLWPKQNGEIIIMLFINQALCRAKEERASISTQIEHVSSLHYSHHVYMYMLVKIITIIQAIVQLKDAQAAQKTDELSKSESEHNY